MTREEAMERFVHSVQERESAEEDYAKAEALAQSTRDALAEWGRRRILAYEAARRAHCDLECVVMGKPLIDWAEVERGYYGKG